MRAAPGFRSSAGCVGPGSGSPRPVPGRPPAGPCRPAAGSCSGGRCWPEFRCCRRHQSRLHRYRRRHHRRRRSRRPRTPGRRGRRRACRRCWSGCPRGPRSRPAPRPGTRSRHSPCQRPGPAPPGAANMASTSAVMSRKAILRMFPPIVWNRMRYKAPRTLVDKESFATQVGGHARSLGQPSRLGATATPRTRTASPGDTPAAGSGMGTTNRTTRRLAITIPAAGRLGIAPTTRPSASWLRDVGVTVAARRPWWRSR